MASGRRDDLHGPLHLDRVPVEAVGEDISDARGRRRRFFVFIAVSRVETTTLPSSSTAAATSDSCGLPSDRVVASTARWLARDEVECRGDGP